MGKHNCSIKTEAGSEFVKRVIEFMQTSDDYESLVVMGEIFNDLQTRGKISQDVWFSAINAWARVREFIDDKEVE